MIALLDMTILALATVLALAAATSMQWILLKVAMLTMRPAAVRPAVLRTELVHATGQLARAYAGHR
jgi:hypothetical protein